MAKQSLLDTLVTNTSGNTYIGPEDTQTIIQDIAEEVKRKIASAEAQSSSMEQE